MEIGEASRQLDSIVRLSDASTLFQAHPEYGVSDNMIVAIRAVLQREGQWADGIVGVLADFAGISAAACTLPQGWMVSTTSFEIHNVAPAVGTRLIAIGTAVSVGKTIAVSRAEVFAENDGVFTLVCVATTTGGPSQIKK